jgi:hypothetical protein
VVGDAAIGCLAVGSGRYRCDGYPWVGTLAIAGTVVSAGTRLGKEADDVREAILEGTAIFIPSG